MRLLNEHILKFNLPIDENQLQCCICIKQVFSYMFSQMIIIRRFKMDKPIWAYILLPSQQYEHMKTLLADLNGVMSKFASSADRTLLRQAAEKYQHQCQSLQKLCACISQEFEDGRINKRTLEAQMESLQHNARELKDSLLSKEKQVLKYSSEIMKISQENQKLKEYIRKLKQEHRGYRAQMEELVQTLSSKVKKYKQEHQEKVEVYEAKIRHLEDKLRERDEVGEDLDRELEELARLQAEVGEEGDDTKNWQAKKR